MPLIRNKRALKAHIKAYLSPLRTECGLLEVEDIKALTQRFGEEEEASEDGEKSLFTLPPLPLEESAVDQWLHKGVLAWLKEQQASEDVIRQVMALAPVSPSSSVTTTMSAASPPSSSSVAGGDAMGVEKGHAAELPQTLPPTPSSGFTFSALRQRLKETREKLEMHPTPNGEGQPKTVNPARAAIHDSNESSSSTGGAQQETVEQDTTQSKVLVSAKSCDGSQERLGQTKHQGEAVETYATGDGVETGSSTRSPQSTTHVQDALSPSSFEFGRDGTTALQSRETAPVQDRERENTRKKVRYEETRETHTWNGEKERVEKKKKPKESSSVASLTFSSPARSSSSHWAESQGGFTVMPLNDDELFDTIPPPPPVMHPLHVYPPPPFPTHVPSQHRLMPSLSPFPPPPPFYASPPSSGGNASALSPAMDAPYDPTAEVYRPYPSPPLFHPYPSYTEEGMGGTTSTEWRGGGAGHNSLSSPPFYSHPSNRSAGGGASFR